MTKVHMIVLCVVDHDGLGADEVVSVLEAEEFPNHCMYPRVVAIETREVVWSDDHPLNQRSTRNVAFRKLFTDEAER